MKGRTGEKSSMWGLTHTADTKKKMSESAKDKTEYTFSHPDFGDVTTIRSDFIKYYGHSASGVSNLILGKIAKYKGGKIK